MQGDIVAILDANGNTVVEYTYDFWGKLENITGSLADTIGTINPLRYRGYYYDTETNLYYLQSRYYSPDLMRFISQDDVKHSNEQGQPIGSNLYAYCLNNPTNKKDPSGEIAISTCILIGSIVVGVLAFGHTAAVSYKYTGKIDWSSAILNGLSWFSLAYSYGTTAYGIYLNYCDYKGLTPTTEVNFNKTQTSLQKCANSVQSSTKGHVSGTKQHTAFAKKVNTLKNKNLKTEVSYKNGKVVKYGTKGSVRLDVVEYDKKGRIVSVYDLKTGNAKLSQKQIKNIQKHLPRKDVIITEIKPQKRK